MALIAMAVWDTEENQRTKYTKRTLDSLITTVDFTKHRLIISDNGSCKDTLALYDYFTSFINITVIYNHENIGTAEAINRAWVYRAPGEHAIKMDNDVIINQSGWVDEMEYAISRYPIIGQIGLKRKDCIEAPWTKGWYGSELQMLPHIPGERWVIVEKVNHVMGTCVMHSSALLDKVGYLYQPGVYGFDDSLMSVRSQMAGFYNCFLSHINIDHIDPGGTDFQSWKEKKASEKWTAYIQTVRDYKEGTKSIYYNPFD